MKSTQKYATMIFIAASIFFGIFGTIMTIKGSNQGQDDEFFTKTLGVLVFTILSSFAVSVGLRYLVEKK